MPNEKRIRLVKVIGEKEILPNMYYPSDTAPVKIEELIFAMMSTDFRLPFTVVDMLSLVCI